MTIEQEFDRWWQENAVFHYSVDAQYMDKMHRMFKYAYVAGAEYQRKRDAAIAGSHRHCDADKSCTCQRIAAAIERGEG